MKKLVLGLVILATASCGVDSSEIGTDFFTDGVLDYSYSDTSSVKLSSITFEKIQTTSSSRLLLGTHVDEKLGRITASSFFQVAPASAIDLRGEDITYNYLALHLDYDQYSYYDTVSSLTVRAFRVMEKMEEEEDGNLYTSSLFSVANEPLGEITFLPRPHRSDSIEIKLSDTLGKELFQKALTADDDLGSSSEFLKYFYGLGVITDTTTSSCLVGFSKTPQLRLYYTDRSSTPVTQKYVSFSASEGGITFSHIDVNRKQTNLNNLSSAEELLPSSDSDDESYLQAGGGVALRVDMPYLRELKLATNFYLQQAVLEMFVVKKSYNGFTPLPTSLIVYKVNKNNEVYEQFANTPTLIEDIDLKRDTRYTLDVTTFVKEQMELQTPNKNGLMFMMSSDYAASVDRLYAAAKSSTYKTRLVLYYATVNN
jgi:hypothetical protein